MHSMLMICAHYYGCARSHAVTAAGSVAAQALARGPARPGELNQGQVT